MIYLCIEQWNAEETASQGITDEQGQAGYGEIISDFGYLYSLYNTTKGNLLDVEKILKKTVGEVYRWEQLQSRINAADKRYSEIININRR